MAKGSSMDKSKTNDDIREHVPSLGREHFKALLGKNPLPVFILDVETGNPEEFLFLAANKAACNQYGYSENEFRKMKMLDLHPREDIQQILEDVAPSRNSRHGEFSSTRPGRHVKKDGTIIWVDVTSHRINFEGRQARVAIARDVTGQIQTRKSLQESEENLRRMLDAVEDLVYVCTSDYTIDFINKALSEELQKEAVGKPCYEAVFDREKPCVGCNLGGVIEGETERYEITNNRSGRIYDVIHAPFSKVDGTLCAIHFMRDITERKNMEEKLKYNYALLETQQEVSPDGILVVNENREMISFNQRFVVMWELSSNIVDTSSDEIAIKSVLDKLVDPEEFISRVNYLYEHPELKSGEEVLLKDGRVFDRHSSAMFSSDREYLGRIWFFRDITERKQAEEALKKAKEDLEKKNEEMEAFIYTAAHDLRTPLISVRGFLNLMRKELVGKLDEESEYHLERVMKNAEHFDNLLGDLLQFSQVGADTGQREEINLSTVAREIAYEIARSYDTEASLVISEKLSLVHMQPSRVHHLFENLITNSVKFKRSGIPLELEIGVGFSDDDMPEGHVPVYVRDNGIGIEEDIQGEIFGLFSRPAVNSEEGTGVGLAIVRRIVEEEGGSIRVESTPGEGTTFYFSLPVVSTSS